MHLLTLLSIAMMATLANTVTHYSVSIDKCTYCPSTSSAPWEIYLFTMFTADACCSGEGGMLSFNFTDPNFYNNANNGLTLSNDVETTIFRSVIEGVRALRV